MLEDFVEDLLVEKGLTDLDPDVRFALIAELVDKANQLINRRLFEAMNEDQLKALNQMVEAKPDQAMVDKFIEENVPNKVQITAQALNEFRSLYLGVTQ